MTVNNPDAWHIADPNHGKNLNSIRIFSDRAISLYSRNKTKIITGHHNIMGAVHMLKGLEYHYNNFISIYSTISHPKIHKSPTKEQLIKMSLHLYPENKVEALKHEAIAYLNRLGQFRVFTRSEFVKGRTKIKMSKRTGKILNAFRDEYSAHRELDKNKDEFKNYNLEQHISGGTMWANKHLIFQYIETNNNWINFDMIDDHPNIIKEVYMIVSGVIKSRK